MRTPRTCRPPKWRSTPGRSSSWRPRSRARPQPRILDGIALAIVAIALVALGGRLFTGFAATAAAGRALPAVVERLSWPVGYWNGLAMLVALALPLLLRNVGRRAVAARLCGGGGRDPADRCRHLSGFVTGRRDRGCRCGCDVRGPVSRPLARRGCSGHRRRRWVAAVLALESRPVLVNGPFGSHAASVAGREVAAAPRGGRRGHGRRLVRARAPCAPDPCAIATSRRRTRGCRRRGSHRRSPRCRIRLRGCTPSRGLRSRPTRPASCAHISSAAAAAAAGSSGPLRSTSGGRRRSSAPARARSPRGGPSTDP